MRVAVFSSKSYDEEFLSASSTHQFAFFKNHLCEQSAVLASGFNAVCCFVNDDVNADVIALLKEAGIRLIVLRCAGFNNVDVAAAKQAGIAVYRVPAYSPHAVAEHAIALILTLNRKTHRAYARVRENDYSLHGLMGFDLYGKTVGVIGTGVIGLEFARIMKGFGCQLLGYDPVRNSSFEQIGGYVALDELWPRCDIISLHCPLSPATHYLINTQSLAAMKHGVMLINTGRGGLLDTRAVIQELKTGKIGSLGLDVYEEEADLFFEDYSDKIMTDDVFARLTTFPNVLVTGHQGFFTKEAMSEIARVTMLNLTSFESDTVIEENRLA
ncbi:2-hydroxyacid dehydrogenase [Saccharophagus degradans]|uniref:2-hydroxyacid dehydrogenase n=1 Tax=Saccharophagus degradans TaxID=86304 RepID=UPI0024781D47|nr:2-hydroxyacid dehydrogenase [Saccharophagus degradans]WGO97506.1 2-hydroxyacid dehydrogenase [Saccharophagus degradans]